MNMIAALEAAEERMKAASNTDDEPGLIHVEDDQVRLAFSGLALTGDEAGELADGSAVAVCEMIVAGNPAVDVITGMLLEMLLVGLLAKESE